MNYKIISLTEPCNFPAGINAAVVKSVSYARDSYNKPKVNADGDYALSVDFMNQHYQGRLTAYVNEKSQWIWDKLCQALVVNNNNREPSINELIGKKLWIHVVGVFDIKDGVIPEEPSFTYILPKFYPMADPDFKPSVSKDPQRSGTYEEGPFVVYKEVKVAEVSLNEREFGDD